MPDELKEGFVVRDRRYHSADGSPTGAEDAYESSPPASPAAPVDRSLEIERLRSALADLEAAKARVERNAERQAELLRGDILAALIPVIDDLQRSIAAGAHSHSVKTVVEGVRLVESKFLSVLENFGLERLSALGTRFDPRVHDAVAVVPVQDPAEDGIVVDELAPAYRYGERIVRPAKVQVGKAATRPVS